MWNGVPTAQVATRAWTVGTTQLTSPTSVEPIPPLLELSKGATKSHKGRSKGAFIPILWKLSKISVSVNLWTRLSAAAQAETCPA